MMSAHAYSPLPTLVGYQQVHSERGRLFYLPTNLHRAVVLDETPIPPVFRGREHRPHRIHIARVNPDHSLPSYSSPDTRPQKRPRVSIIVGKLANSKDSAKKFLRSFIASGRDPETGLPLQRDRPLSWVSTRSTDKLLFGRRPRSGVWGDKEERRRSVADMRPGLRQSIADPLGMASRISAANEGAPNSSRTSLEPVPGVNHGHRILEEKPLAAGSGISVGIALAEPVLFLQGFEQGDLQANRSTAMLRGSLHLRVQKAAKIKAVTLRFRGRATTTWPEGIPPKKTEFAETTTQMSHTWPFFNAQFPNAETGTGADHVELYKTPHDIASAKNKSSIDILSRSPASRSNLNLSSKEAKRLSLQVNQSRSFGKGESPTGGPSVAQKGYRTFQPGDYIYNFELPLDSHLPETIEVELGSVKYELEAIVERAGAFKPNLIGTKEVVVIRTPAEGSLEQVEPIAISRNWEDQLHYDIVISGKSFPLGAQIPIAFKLTPLAKVQCHRVKVFITESIEYYCNNKRVHRMEPTRKVQLYEKRADGPPVSTFPGSSMRIISGGGIPWDLRQAAAAGQDVPPPDPTNLLGPLESDRSIGPLEMEFNVQLPSCVNMKDKDKSLRLHFDTTYSNIQVHHWIKIVMRLSRQDAVDPAKRRHFEISIDSPFHILSCRATQANTSLPAYSSPEPIDDSQQLHVCGCPGAAVRRNSPTSYVPTLNNLNPGPGVINRHTWSPVAQPQPTRTDSTGLTRPQAAHVSGPSNPALARPMHIIRVPSFNPPSFEAEEPPPPLETPPPQYDTIASPTSGLADYFQRLSDAYQEDSEDDGQSTPTGRSRVEVPLTPGARAGSRSMDEPRGWVPLVDGVPSGALTGPIIREREREGMMSSVASSQDSASMDGAVGAPIIEPSATLETASVSNFQTISSESSRSGMSRPMMQRS